MARYGAGEFFSVDVRGFRMVRRRMQSKLREATFNIEAGVKEGALMIKRNAQKRTPIVTGNLKASAYVSSFRWGPSSMSQALTGQIVGPAAEVGYTAVYAAAVHQSPNAGQLGHLNPSTGPQVYSYVGEPKFLEKAVEFKKEDVRIIIARRAAFTTGSV